MHTKNRRERQIAFSSEQYAGPGADLTAPRSACAPRAAQRPSSPRPLVLVQSTPGQRAQMSASRRLERLVEPSASLRVPPRVVASPGRGSEIAPDLRVGVELSPLGGIDAVPPRPLRHRGGHALAIASEGGGQVAGRREGEEGGPRRGRLLDAHPAADVLGEHTPDGAEREGEDGGRVDAAHGADEARVAAVEAGHLDKVGREEAHVDHAEREPLVAEDKRHARERAARRGGRVSSRHVVLHQRDHRAEKAGAADRLHHAGGGEAVVQDDVERPAVSRTSVRREGLTHRQDRPHVWVQVEERRAGERLSPHLDRPDGESPARGVVEPAGGRRLVSLLGEEEAEQVDVRVRVHLAARPLKHVPQPHESLAVGVQRGGELAGWGRRTGLSGGVAQLALVGRRRRGGRGGKALLEARAEAPLPRRATRRRLLGSSPGHRRCPWSLRYVILDETHVVVGHLANVALRVAHEPPELAVVQDLKHLVLS
mmetsp:Transcript_17518/g.51821  ORF Transcript_17518/g.51821 Transcript_17518/m.51821 type:complete len:483 (+) Transcript_17518:63-1511(+)